MRKNYAQIFIPLITIFISAIYLYQVVANRYFGDDANAQESTMEESKGIFRKSKLTNTKSIQSANTTSSPVPPKVEEALKIEK